MKTKKMPERTCIYTRIKALKKDMIRLVKNENDIYVLDEFKKMQKRGIYIYPCKKSLELINKNKKYKILEEDIEKIIEYIKVGGMDE